MATLRQAASLLIIWAVRAIKRITAFIKYRFSAIECIFAAKAIEGVIKYREAGMKMRRYIYRNRLHVRVKISFRLIWGLSNRHDGATIYFGEGNDISILKIGGGICLIIMLIAFKHFIWSFWRFEEVCADIVIIFSMGKMIAMISVPLSLSWSWVRHFYHILYMQWLSNSNAIYQSPTSHMDERYNINKCLRYHCLKIVLINIFQTFAVIKPFSNGVSMTKWAL